MSEFNYTTFENNVIGAVTQVAFGNLNSLLVYDSGSIHYVVLVLVYYNTFLVYTFRVFACLPSGDRYLYCFIYFDCNDLF